MVTKPSSGLPTPTLAGSPPNSRSREDGHSRASPATTESKPSGYAGEAYLALIRDLLADETASRELLERRAVGVLATMAVIVTVLATLLSGEGLSKVWLGPWSAFLAAEAATVFIFAGFFAWRTILPRSYRVAAISALRRIVESGAFWSGDPRIGTQRSAESLLELLASTRTANGNKAWTLAAAMGLELVAVGLLVAVVIAFIKGA